MVDRFVVSKSRMVRVPCDGPLTAQIESCKLEEEMKAAGQQPDVEIEFRKNIRPRARSLPARKRNTLLRHK